MTQFIELSLRPHSSIDYLTPDELEQINHRLYFKIRGRVLRRYYIYAYFSNDPPCKVHELYCPLFLDHVKLLYINFLLTFVV